MSEWSLERIEAVRGDVVLQCRHWDGIDRPEWLSIRLGPEQAQKWAMAMVERAGEAAGQQAEANSQRRQDAISKRDALNAQIAELDAIITPPRSG